MGSTKRAQQFLLAHQTVQANSSSSTSRGLLPCTGQNAENSAASFLGVGQRAGLFLGQQRLDSQGKLAGLDAQQLGKFLDSVLYPRNVARRVARSAKGGVGVASEGEVPPTASAGLCLRETEAIEGEEDDAGSREEVDDGGEAGVGEGKVDAVVDDRLFALWREMVAGDGLGGCW